MQAPEGGKWVTDVTLPMNRELAQRAGGFVKVVDVKVSLLNLTSVCLGIC